MREKTREKKIDAGRTRRRQRRLPRGRGAVKGCDSRSRATYRTPQVQRTDREVEGSFCEHRDVERHRRYRLLRVDARHSAWPRRRTHIQNSFCCYDWYFIAEAAMHLKSIFVGHCLLTSSVFYSYLLRDKNEIFSRTLHVIAENPGFFWKSLSDDFYYSWLRTKLKELDFMLSNYSPHILNCI